MNWPEAPLSNAMYSCEAHSGALWGAGMGSGYRDPPNNGQHEHGHADDAGKHFPAANTSSQFTHTLPCLS